MKYQLINLLKTDGINSKNQVLKILQQPNIEVVDITPRKVLHVDEYKLSGTCPRCKFHVSVIEKFCKSCGTLLDWSDFDNAR